MAIVEWANSGRLYVAAPSNFDLFYFSISRISCPAIINGNGFPGQRLRTRCESLVPYRQSSKTPPEVILEAIGLVIAPKEEAPAHLVPLTSHGFDLLTAATL